MATTQMPIEGVFDRETGQFIGVSDENGKEIPVATFDSQNRLLGADGGVVLDVGAVQASLDGRVYLTDPAFGYVGGGFADSALRAAIASGAKILTVPAGRFVFSSTGPLLTQGSITLEGAGMYETIFEFQDSGPTLSRLFGDNSGLERNINISGIGFESSRGHGGNYDQRSQLVYIQSTGVVVIDKCRFEKSRNMSLIIEGAKKAITTGCVFADGNKDGCRHINCKESIITANVFNGICDDAIAVHSLDSATAPLDRAAIISQNIIIDSQGIACLGAKRQSISNNVIIRAKTRAILAGSAPLADQSEGNTCGMNISITGNVIDTVFDQFEMTGVGGGGSYYIQVSGSPLTQAGDGFVGQGSTSGGVVSPFGHFYTNNTDTSVNPGNWFVNVSNNVCTRTYEPTVSYLSYGLGMFPSRGGPVDVAVSDAALGLTSDRAQITFEAAINNALVCGNLLWGGNNGILFRGDLSRTYAAWRGVKVASNIIANYKLKAVYAIGKGVIEFCGNSYDGDPLNTNSARASNGKWGGGYATSAVYHFDGPRALVRSETWRNVGQVFIGASSTDHQWQQNVACCYPSAVGYNVNNSGIGLIPRPDSLGQTFVIEDCDPSSATYGQIVSAPAASLTTMPTSGHYVVGAFVRNSLPVILGSAGGQYVITGWLRRTTNSSHTLNVDWVECRNPTGT